MQAGVAVIGNAEVVVYIYYRQMISCYCMSQEIFFEKVRSYTNLSDEAEEAWSRLLQARIYNKGDHFVNEGQVPRKVAFVVKGLFSQYYITDSGDTVIKYFFPEGRIAGSVSAMLTQSPGIFTITALEQTTVLEYDFTAFKQLVAACPDVAAFYIRYMEQHWIVDKEPYEISLRHDTARVRYDAFLLKYPELVKRLKKHHIAAYLGITPTQLSRIFVSR
jgi:CRP-like cAMP-binding protein